MEAFGLKSFRKPCDRTIRPSVKPQEVTMACFLTHNRHGPIQNWSDTSILSRRRFCFLVFALCTRLFSSTIDVLKGLASSNSFSFDLLWWSSVCCHLLKWIRVQQTKSLTKQWQIWSHSLSKKKQHGREQRAKISKSVVLMKMVSVSLLMDLRMRESHW